MRTLIIRVAVHGVSVGGRERFSSRCCFLFLDSDDQNVFPAANLCSLELLLLLHASVPPLSSQKNPHGTSVGQIKGGTRQHTLNAHRLSNL